MLNHFLQTYGYLAVVAFVGLESLGVPLPGETMLVAAALYAGTTHQLSVAVIAAVAAVAAIAGDNVGYALGRTGGQRLVSRYGRYIHLTGSRLAVGRYLFRRHGGKVVFYGRFVSVLRTYAALLAGVNRMPWRRFVIANAAGGALWATVVAVGAYQLGSAATGVGNVITIAGLAAAALFAIVSAVAVRRSLAKLEERALAEEASPQPAAVG